MVIGKMIKSMEKVYKKMNLGTMYYVNGDIYNGEWVNDEKNGKCKN